LSKTGYLTLPLQEMADLVKNNFFVRNLAANTHQKYDKHSSPFRFPTLRT